VRRARCPLSVVSAAALLLALAACSDEKLEPSGGGGGGADIRIVAGDAGDGAGAGDVAAGPTWNGEVQAIFAGHCIFCHSTDNVGGARNGAPPGVNFDTYEEATENAERALARMTAGTMPPPGNSVGAEPVTEPERSVVQAWIDAGMPR